MKLASFELMYEMTLKEICQILFWIFNTSGSWNINKSP